MKSVDKIDLSKPHQKYFNSQGEEVLGVTSLIGKYIAKHGLLKWAWKMGKEGKELDKEGRQSAYIGTLAHYIVECFLCKSEPSFELIKEDKIECIKPAIEIGHKFIDWFVAQGYETIECEQQLCSDHGYGGTIDIICKDKQGQVCVVDLKTGKGIHTEHKIQLTAYAMLVEEVKGLKVDKCIVVNCNQTTLDVLEFVPSEAEKNVFKAILQLHQAFRLIDSV